jgi:hypothetical protein
MRSHPPLTRGRTAAAVAVAIAVDVIQFPLTLAFVGSVLSAVGLPLAGPIETLDLALDVVTAAIEIGLLGFHWILLPTAIIEGVPFLDFAPTWTGCVWWVLRSRRKAATEQASGALARIP